MQTSNRYLYASLACFAIAIIAALHIGCAPMNGKALFNYSQERYLASTYHSEQSIDVLVTVRIRAFGNEDEKRKEWCKAWPVWCKPHLPSAGVSVSSKIPEIWLDLRENENGEIVLPDHILSHEMNHTIKLYDSRVKDPDR